MDEAVKATSGKRPSSMPSGISQRSERKDSNHDENRLAQMAKEGGVGIICLRQASQVLFKIEN